MQTVLAERSPHADEATRWTERPTCILLVEDSEDDAFLLQAQLKRSLGLVEVRHVQTEVELRAALAERRWDLVISDHQLPSFDSSKAMRVTREYDQSVPIIVFSGVSDNERGTDALKEGAADFVNKANVARLIPVIQRELNGVRKLRDKDQALNQALRSTLYDELTALPSARQFAEKVNQQILSTNGSDQPALCHIDLHRFAQFNESFGYEVGDGLLCAIAERLRVFVGPNDALTRLGQDKFAVFLADATHLVAGSVGGCGMLTCFDEPFVTDQQEFFVTANIGIAIHPQHGTDADSLLQKAQTASATAKQSDERVALYADIESPQLARRMMLEGALRGAIGRNELFLLYQPFFSVRDRALVGAEALLRWQHPTLGLVPPDQIVAIADESGQIDEIGGWVLREACKQAQLWRTRGLVDFVIAVNFSARQFKQGNMVEFVRGVLEETGLPAHALEIEITETLAMTDAEGTVRTLRALKAMGIRVAIDDFGTGYSSLAYLKRFPIDVLKIDKSFVRELSEAADDRVLVRTIAALGKAMRLSVHAEGVETEPQLALVSAEGCDRAQGYLISKPIAADALERMAFAKHAV